MYLRISINKTKITRLQHAAGSLVIPKPVWIITLEACESQIVIRYTGYPVVPAEIEIRIKYTEFIVWPKVSIIITVEDG